MSVSSSRLIRIGGLAAVVSGALFVVAELAYLVVGIDPPVEDLASAPAVVQSGLFLLAQVLLAGALVGLYAARSEALGAVGSAGFLVAFVGSVLSTGLAWTGVFVFPELAREAPELLETQAPALVIAGEVLSFGLLTLGWVLFGVATLRARAYPRAAAVLLVVGAVLAFFPLPFSTIVFGVAVAWVGLTLLPAGAGAAAERPARVS